MTTYGDSNLADAYNKYKAFGYAVQNLNSNAQKSQGSAVAVEASRVKSSESANPTIASTALMTTKKLQFVAPIVTTGSPKLHEYCARLGK